MKKLTIEIDAGETTCDGCELFRQGYQSGPECRKFGVLKIKNYIAGQHLSYNSERHPKCLAAEQREETKMTDEIKRTRMMCKTEKENLELRLTILRGNYEQVEKLLNASHEALTSKDAEIATLKARCDKYEKALRVILEFAEHPFPAIERLVMIEDTVHKALVKKEPSLRIIKPGEKYNAGLYVANQDEKEQSDE
jgi:hypothetical protein